ncbi:hypothetical protein [Stackebrandtia nassauensis]|uniref:Uncharacterized protein n=1 Tax=Stackebrandtia nassauensis (strain DSM 44728 / CIP 108903 / NRRL B-16338 / NBRC 102104 / LLR-40K-21) TaxID=446470 RepID=D3Q0G9_STANL|nr:hypothetical protein [Stackebrandtia nassauensis]ADD41705.1 hypothetical protein Snas_2010 [Stackebrandtia nassauensis DSM 44728]
MPKWWTKRVRLTASAAVVVATISAAVITLVVTGDADSEADGVKVIRPEGAASCEVVKLDSPDSGSPVLPEGVSPEGEYIIGDATGASGLPGLWRDGKPIRFTGLDKSLSHEVSDVTDSGAVVGTTTSGGEDESVLGWRWEDDRVRELSENWATPTAIDEGGTIIGERSDGELVKWDEAKGKTSTITLEVDDDMYATLNDVSEDGVMVGRQEDGGSEGEFDPYQQARIWDGKGKGRNVPLDGSVRSQVVDISGDWVLIRHDQGEFRWNITGEDRPEKLDGILAQAIDGSGNVYGTLERGKDSLPGLYDGELRPLPVLGGVDEHGPASDSAVSAVSADGSVLAGDWKGNPVMWSCG